GDGGAEVISRPVAGFDEALCAVPFRDLIDDRVGRLGALRDRLRCGTHRRGATALPRARTAIKPPSNIATGMIQVRCQTLIVSSSQSCVVRPTRALREGRSRLP